ncbi:pyridoxine/pyridoxamine 5'-phosphate oxidase 2 isoform X1 [Lycium barbarum]|uniref:pyridoxine/pyridoxamine 5'-phosphate oxidase 2 isoform X1 n=1 Tax=Lycium barbarum TaxID=112863 RepID=UPI00293EC35F|nr:pyridoxine/pyridoxamine 5'-phosphate oxidase 2 isoform X1 [Lycium barbarum]
MSSSATAPWKQLLLNSINSNSHLKHSTYFQLATVGYNGRPSNRTVVFRGFQDGTNKIQINTDSRSSKIDDLKRSPFAEVCWYFTETWEQFRIYGKVEMIDASNSDPNKLKQREAAWFAGSVRSRLQYVGPTPGIISLNEQPSHDSLDPSAGPVDAFCLLLLDPDQVDYLNLKSNERLLFSTGRSDNDFTVPDERNQLNLKHMRTKVPLPNL